MDTKMLICALGAAVDEAIFDLKITEISSEGEPGQPVSQRATAAKCREIYLREINRPVKLHARASVPDTAMTPLTDALRHTLGKFIHPDTDRIGHAFPVDGSDHDSVAFRPDGLVDKQARSPVREFAHALVRAGAIMGIEQAVGLLDSWAHGKPEELRMCTVLSGLHLAAPLSPRADIRIVPLALTTADLPRLPIRRDRTPRDYLGLTLLTVQLSASPALFRPDTGAEEETVRSSSVDGMNVRLVCDALSLQSGSHVSPGFVWHEHPDAAPFCLTHQETWGPTGDDRLRPMVLKSASRDMTTGVWTVTPSEDTPPQVLDEEEFSRILEAMQAAKAKLRISVDRWRRSMRPDARIEDSYIDLRIALEALYLKDFDDKRTQEMRLRLALFGAWHLAETPDERRSIFNDLRAAYDMASQAVHGGEIKGAEQPDQYRKVRTGLTLAQDLCRRGILKLLLDGQPKDWTDLVLGGPGS